MSDFAPPVGPPPPKVPEGWKAVWNEQYSEYFYVNLYTKQSQWEKPTEPVYPSSEAPPQGPPPPRTDNSSRLSSNNPYAGSAEKGRSSNDISEDERLAKRLQEEKKSRGYGNNLDSRSEALQVRTTTRGRRVHRVNLVGMVLRINMPARLQTRRVKVVTIRGFSGSCWTRRALRRSQGRMALVMVPDRMATVSRTVSRVTVGTMVASR